VTFTQNIPLLSETVSVRSVVIVKNVDLENLTDLHVLGPSEYEKMVCHYAESNKNEKSQRVEEVSYLETS
jgi:hypothetical protein